MSAVIDALSIIPATVIRHNRHRRLDAPQRMRRAGGEDRERRFTPQPWAAEASARRRAF
jgi:hypothetical protein